MFVFLGKYYLWIKALHVIAMIAWISGMMYLPRLFVYHCDAALGSQQSETFKLMELRLLKGIINPAMIVTILLGTMLLFTKGVIDWADGWIWVKLALVLALTALHGLFALWRKDFEADNNQRPAKFYRYANEVPFVLVALIVLLVYRKPFGNIF